MGEVIPFPRVRNRPWAARHARCMRQMGPDAAERHIRRHLGTLAGRLTSISIAPALLRKIAVMHLRDRRRRDGRETCHHDLIDLGSPIRLDMASEPPAVEHNKSAWHRTRLRNEKRGARLHRPDG